MKKIFYILFLFISILYISCASNKTGNIKDNSYEYDDYEDEESTQIVLHQNVTDDFAGDFNPIMIDDIMFLKKTKNDVIPKQMKKVYFVPRNNCVEFYFRDIANEICFSFNKNERSKITSACETFLKQYEEKTVPHNKVNAKTAYIKSTCALWFGVLSPEIECSNTDYYINVEFINKRPYLLLKFVPSRCDKTDAFTPAISLYLSPSQTRDFIEILDQEYLLDLLTELEEKAYTY